jgi:hypothetical protein
MKEELGFEDSISSDIYDGTEDLDRMRDQAVNWLGHGNRIRAIAALQDRNALLEYVGDEDEKAMQWIAENLDLDCPNQYMISDLAQIVDSWGLKKITANNARHAILTTLVDYIGGC